MHTIDEYFIFGKVIHNHTHEDAQLNSAVQWSNVMKTNRWWLAESLVPDFPDVVLLDGMARVSTPVIQALLAVLTGAPEG